MNLRNLSHVPSAYSVRRVGIVAFVVRTRGGQFGRGQVDHVTAQDDARDVKGRLSHVRFVMETDCLLG